MSAMFWVKHYVRGGEFLVAVCDEALLGKTFDEGEFTLEVKESFYKGNLVNEEDLKHWLNGATIMNFVGNNCTKTAIDEGIALKKSVIKIRGVPHLQVVRI
jgi:hypothetical protein